MGKSKDRIEEALKVLADFGPYDGAHHKDWVIQEAIRLLRGWEEGELLAWLRMVEWERGVPP